MIWEGTAHGAVLLPGVVLGPLSDFSLSLLPRASTGCLQETHTWASTTMVNLPNCKLHEPHFLVYYLVQGLLTTVTESKLTSHWAQTTEGLLRECSLMDEGVRRACHSCVLSYLVARLFADRRKPWGKAGLGGEQHL